MFPNVADILWLIIPIAIWSSLWKAIGLWFSARKNEKAWFVVFTFINLAGTLEIHSSVNLSADGV